MSTSRRDETATPPVDEGESEHTIIDGKVEHTVKVAYSAQEKTPPPDPIEHTAPGVPPPAPAPPPTTSGSTKWQPRRDTGETRRAAPTVSVAQPTATRPPSARPAAAPARPVAAAPRPAAMAPQSTPPPAKPLAAEPTPPPARSVTPEPPPFTSFDDERPQALTFSKMFEKDAQTAFAKLQYWLRIALAWVTPRAKAGARAVATFTVTTWQKATAAVQGARAPANGKSTLDLEAESSNVADPTRAKKWDQFRQGKQSSGYLIKDDK